MLLLYGSLLLDVYTNVVATRFTLYMYAIAFVIKYGEYYSCYLHFVCSTLIRYCYLGRSHELELLITFLM